MVKLHFGELPINKVVQFTVLFAENTIEEFLAVGTQQVLFNKSADFISMLLNDKYCWSPKKQMIKVG